MSTIQKMLKKPRVICACQPDDRKMIDAADHCQKNDCVLVLIVPCRKKLSDMILSAYLMLGDHLWLYELNMGMQVVLDARARDYHKIYPYSVIYDS